MDLNDRVTKITQPNGGEYSYTYDEAGRLKSMTSPLGYQKNFSYDAADNVVKETDSLKGVNLYTYDRLHRMVSSTNALDGTSHYKYDRYGNLLYVTAENSAELEAGTRKTPSFSGWYNWGGQKIKEDAECCHEEKTVRTSRTYEYDGNWELVRCTEKVEGGTQTVHNYTYDKAGNRTVYERVEDGVQTVKYKYTYNDSNQLVKKINCRIWGDKGACYKYDADGNLITAQENTYEDPVKYEYTAENRMNAVRQGGMVLMAAMYDGDNNRVFQIDNTYKWEDCYGKEVLIPQSQRTEDGDSPKEQLASVVKGGANAKGYTLTEYVNDINRENAEALMEYGADEKVRQAYVYGEERVSVDKTGENSYYLYNGQGSVTGLLTENGKLTNSYRYDPYGSLLSGTPDAVNYYGYNGESANVKTGFQYLRARYYNPASGTFTSEDPYLGTQTEPLSRNRYAYTQNNPVNYTDPAGYARGAKTASSSRKGGLAGVVAGVAKSVAAVGKSTSLKVQSAVTGAKAVQAAKSNPNYWK
ncbi:RHS repeat-associated core domain-containing protein [Lachnospiraceae bacterium 62-26]